jgi:hypothetical protein
MSAAKSALPHGLFQCDFVTSSTKRLGLFFLFLSLMVAVTTPEEFGGRNAAWLLWPGLK